MMESGEVVSVVVSSSHAVDAQAASTVADPEENSNSKPLGADDDKVSISSDSEDSSSPSSDSSSGSEKEGIVKKKAGTTVKVAINGDEESKIKKKRAAPGSKQKTYAEMIKLAILELDNKGGATLQSIKRFISEKYDLALAQKHPTRFNTQICVALKKLVDSDILLKNGWKYRLEASLMKTLRSKKRAKEDMIFNRRLKNGEVSLQEMTEYKRRKEDELEEKRARKNRRPSSSSTKKTSRVVLPLPPTPKSDLLFPGELAHELMSFSEACNEFSRILRLTPFTVDMLYRALSSLHVTSLIREIHVAFLRLCLDPQVCEDEVLSRTNWFEVLNSITWQEIMRRFLLLTSSKLGKAYPDYHALRDAAKRLRGSGYASLPIKTKIAVLRMLLDESFSHKYIQDEIEYKVKTKSNLGVQKWHEDNDDRMKLNICKAKKKVLDKGQMPLEDDEENENKVVQSKKTKKPKIKISTAPVNERAIDNAKKLNSKQIEDLKRRMEQRNAQYLRDKFKHRFRAEPLGRDGPGNQVWHFQSDPSRLYIFGSALRGEKFGRPTWRYYDTKEDLDSYIASLGDGSQREKMLLTNLERFYQNITRRFPRKVVTGEAGEGGKDNTSRSSTPTNAGNESLPEEIPLCERIRPRRGAAKVAESLIKGQTVPYGPGGQQYRKRVEKTWKDSDPNAFEMYVNLLGPSHGRELDPFGSREDEDSEDEDVAELMMFQNADYPVANAKIVEREFFELAEYLNRITGQFTKETSLADFKESVTKALKPLYESEGAATVVSLERIRNSSFESMELAEPRRDLLRSLSLQLEKAATDSIILMKRRKIMDKEKSRRKSKEKPVKPQTRPRVPTTAIERRLESAKQRELAMEIKQQERLIRMERKRQEREDRKLAAELASGKRMRPRRAATRTANIEREEPPPKRTTTLSGRWAKVNYMEKSDSEEEDEDEYDSQAEDSEEEDSEEESIEDELEEDEVEEIPEEEDVEEEAEAEQEEVPEQENKDEQEPEEKTIEDDADDLENIKVNNTKIDVPKSEEERLERIAQLHKLFAFGTIVRIEHPARATNDDNHREMVNGTVVSCHPATFITSRDVVDKWCVRLENGKKRYLDEEQVNVGVANFDISGIAANEVVIPEDVAAEPDVDQHGKMAIKHLWGAASDRREWISAMDTLQTYSGWSYTICELSHRISSSNTLKA
mmetsp:Transcript_10463/g.19591  ORF Transcript_10463/g.19591 Transcript_10463/m.19591 type:complete len:1189 (+) Transcript_10463:3-3569(+)